MVPIPKLHLPTSPDLHIVEASFLLAALEVCAVSDLTNTLLTEWAQIPAGTLQNLVGSLPRRVEAVTAAKGGQLHINAYGFGM